MRPQNVGNAACPRRQPKTLSPKAVNREAGAMLVPTTLNAEGGVAGTPGGVCRLHDADNGKHGPHQHGQKVDHVFYTNYPQSARVYCNSVLECLQAVFSIYLIYEVK